MDLNAVLGIENVDLQKLSRACNCHGCPRFPTKEAVVLELGSKGSKEVVALYFCSEHYGKNMNTIMQQLESACPKGKALDLKVSEIGYVTY